MSKFDGSPDDLSYGQALVELAGRVSWPSEAHGAEVVAAIEAEHGIGLDRAAAEPTFYDPRDADLVAKDAELAELRAKLAARERAEAEAAKDAELAELRAQLGAEPVPESAHQDRPPKLAAKSAK